MDKRLISVGLSILVVFSVSVSNAEESSVLKLTQTLFLIPCPTGYEEPVVEVITGILPSGFQIKRDNLGSLYWGPGNGISKLAVCTPMDEAGYFVSGINPEGYLRLDKAINVPSLIDSYHLGHPMVVWTDNGPVEGVLALPSLHILTSEGRKEFQENPGLQLAFLDVGVDSETETREKGIEMLDAVTPWREITKLAGGKMAGHSLGLKCCMALVLDQTKRFSKSRTPTATFVWMAQTKFPMRRSRPRSALGALCVSKEVRAKNIIVVDVYPCDAESQRNLVVGNGPVLVYSEDKITEIGERIRDLSRDLGLPLQIAPDYSSSVLNPFSANDREVTGLFLPVKFAQTPSEIVDARDVKALDSLLSALLEEGKKR
jgi:putative aminopeptidase FrvX